MYLPDKQKNHMFFFRLIFQNYIFLNLYTPRANPKLEKLIFIINSRAKKYYPLISIYAIKKGLLWYTRIVQFITQQQLITFRKTTQWMHLSKNFDLNCLLPNNLIKKYIFNNSTKFKIKNNIKRSRTHLALLLFLQKKQNYLTKLIKYNTKLNSNHPQLSFLSLKTNWLTYLLHQGMYINKPTSEHYLLTSNQYIINMPINYKIYNKIISYWHNKLNRQSPMYKSIFINRKKYYNYYNYKIKIKRPKTIDRIYYKYDLSRQFEFDFMSLSIFYLNINRSLLPIWYFLLFHTFYNHFYTYNWTIEH